MPPLTKAEITARATADDGEPEPSPAELEAAMGPLVREAQAMAEPLNSAMPVWPDRPGHDFGSPPAVEPFADTFAEILSEMARAKKPARKRPPSKRGPPKLPEGQSRAEQQAAYHEKHSLEAAAKKSGVEPDTIRRNAQRAKRRIARRGQ
jgi:hypothetical protein